MRICTMNNLEKPPGEHPYPPMITKRFQSEAHLWRKDLDHIRLVVEHEVRDLILEAGGIAFRMNEEYTRGNLVHVHSQRFNIGHFHLSKLEKTVGHSAYRDLKYIELQDNFYFAPVIASDLEEKELGFVVCASNSIKGLEHELNKALMMQSVKFRALVPRVRRFQQAVQRILVSELGATSTG